MEKMKRMCPRWRYINEINKCRRSMLSECLENDKNEKSKKANERTNECKQSVFITSFENVSPTVFVSTSEDASCIRQSVIFCKERDEYRWDSDISLRSYLNAFCPYTRDRSIRLCAYSRGMTPAFLRRLKCALLIMMLCSKDDGTTGAGAHLPESSA